MDTPQTPIDRRLTLVSETDTEDGMVDLTFEMDPAFEAELQEAAAAKGVDLSTFLRDALLQGIRQDVTQAMAAGTVEPEEAAHLLAMLDKAGQQGATGGFDVAVSSTPA